MKLKLFIPIIILLLLSCGNRGRTKEYLVFKPIVAGDDHPRSPSFIQEDSIPQSEFENFKYVLKNYKADYFVEDGKIYIDSKEYSEKELMWNYTLKARDSVWLKENRGY
ncbi:hypothetical protein M2451_002374 [Dysgonomonas sp. PFB1-18]|uniref:hypothetical protein n=1 Tax=unclassified Dysgonomonas TaxID=2630389 RepID=UPI0024753A41|nr:MULTISPECIES: hypothetical protein [unclassified Dysgonomonas]MDH6307140.1 hypothetical protein [Dysgonomonas sp. PF1-14]MDH6337059.1 hypothetical protein [Dysgonomonas sp. PF1-16]MDH6381045.1 hypothetical protein [Dysgonomonas sp. PFB1-18]MDH6396376.1 hypothetical protein [Dysgonomonas sp. PF1-23]